MIFSFSFKGSQLFWLNLKLGMYWGWLEIGLTYGSIHPGREFDAISVCKLVRHMGLQNQNNTHQKV